LRSRAIPHHWFFFAAGSIRKNFWHLNPQTGTERQLTDLPASLVIGDFDVSPDGLKSSS
jgi:hypothetical protein